MKKTLVATTLLLSSSLLWAAGQGHDHNQHAKSSPHVEKSMDMGSMPMMKDKMSKMQSQMEEIKKTNDPEKREQLIQAHKASMHDMMKMMQNKMGNDKEKNMMMMMMDQMMQNQDATEETNRIKHDHRLRKTYE